MFIDLLSFLIYCKFMDKNITNWHEWRLKFNSEMKFTKLEPVYSPEEKHETANSLREMLRKTKDKDEQQRICEMIQDTYGCPVICHTS